MAQVTYTCNKDARIADNGSSLGAGASTRNPIGLYSGYLYRTLLGFPVSYAGMVSITKAVLKVKTSDQYYCAFGSDPDFQVYGCSSNWSEGSAVSMSSTNAVEWSNQPGVRAQHIFCTPSESQNVWMSFDITPVMVEQFNTGAFYGFRLQANNEGTTADTTEIWSREGGAAPQLIIDYTTNVGPNPPINLACTPAVTPTFQFDHSDNDGDALLNYDIQVTSDASFATITHWNGSAVTTGIAGNHVSVVGPAMSRGVPYYWRVATRSATGIATTSGWTTGPSFQLNQLPTTALVTPSAADVVCQMYKTAGSGVNPRLYVSWTFSDPDGGAQAEYQVNVVNDNGTAFWDSGRLSGATSAVVVPVDAVRGNFYKVTVTVWDSAGDSANTGQRRCKAQWSVAEYRIDLLGTVTAWSTSAVSTAPANTAVVTEYASSAAGGAIGTWFSSIASAALGRWFHYRVFLFAWSGAASPSFTRLSLTYTNSAGVPPDGWTVTGQHAIDTSTKVYGTQSLRVTCNGTTLAASQKVQVQKNTDYILSGRIKSDGNSGAFVAISSGPSVGVIVSSPPVAVTQEFGRVSTPVWNSGDNEEIYILCRTDAPAPGRAWFDALKLEASRVVTSWNPGLVGYGLSIDAGGIKVDASPDGGATMRLQAAHNTARDVVELGTYGLKFGGDTELSSDVAGVLTVPPLDGFGMYGLRAGGHIGVTGGGLCTFDAAANFKWAAQFITISMGTGPEAPLNGYYDITCPLSGTVQGVGTHPNVTATAAGIPMAIWDALYVVLPKGLGSGVITVNDFRLMAYNMTSNFVPPSNWVLLATRNGDDGVLYVANGLRMLTNQNLQVGGTLDVRGNVVANAVFEGAARLVQPAGLLIQRGVATSVANGTALTAHVIVTFPQAYSAPPVVVALSDNGWRSAGMGNPPTTTNFGIYVSDNRGSAIANGTNCLIYWIAIGPA